jgi:molecular chaperone DnaK
VTITASTNLTDADIDKAVKEAEKFAAEDKKRKEEIEIRNNADSMVYQSEKTLKDLGDKLGDDDKAKIETEINNVKEALKGTDNEKIKTATEALTQAFYDISSKIYQQNPGAAGGPNPGAGFDGGAGGFGGGPEAGPDAGQDNVYDADYKVVDDDKKE